MKKYFSLSWLFTLLFVACVKVNFDLDFSNPCTETTTKINITVRDFYTRSPLVNQKFKLSLQEIFSASETLKELAASDSAGMVSYTFTHEPRNSLHNYWIDQIQDSSVYFALSRINVLPGCTNDLDIPMKKAGALSLLLKNESGVAHGKCRLDVSVKFINHQIIIDTFPIGYSKTFEVTKLPEERVTIWLYTLAMGSTFKQQDTLRANKAEIESYTMTVR